MSETKRETKLKVLFAASECLPFVKTGGLADVAGALPAQLCRDGADARIVLPFYKPVKQKYKAQCRHVCDFILRLGWRSQYCGIEQLVHGGVTYYLSTTNITSAGIIFTAASIPQRASASPISPRPFWRCCRASALCRMCCI